MCILRRSEWKSTAFQFQTQQPVMNSMCYCCCFLFSPLAPNARRVPEKHHRIINKSSQHLRYVVSSWSLSQEYPRNAKGTTSCFPVSCVLCVCLNRLKVGLTPFIVIRKRIKRELSEENVDKRRPRRGEWVSEWLSLFWPFPIRFLLCSFLAPRQI